MPARKRVIKRVQRLLTPLRPYTLIYYVGIIHVVTKIHLRKALSLHSIGKVDKVLYAELLGPFGKDGKTEEG